MTVEALEGRDRRRRRAAAAGLLAAGPAGVALAVWATGTEGPAVGAVLAALLLAAVAHAVSPAPWTPAERRHRRLEAIWRSLRSDLDADVPWARHVAWAEPDGEHVVLSLVARHPGEPDRYDERTAQRLDPEDVEAAAEAMEALREEAAEREAQAREAWHAQAAEADRLRHAQALRAIDAAGRAELDRRDAQLRREVAEQERAERRAQARAVAEALRRP